MTREWSLAAVLIARDEERCIGRAIDSVRSFVDAIVVLDTGSVDATARIAEERGARVARWEWRDDFALARNAALALSDADVNLVLDADEWLLDPRGFRWPARAVSEVGILEVRSSSSADGVPVTTTTQLERVLPRGVEYVGAVHEAPRHGLRTYVSGLVLGHDGYEPAIAAVKAGRNERILRRELASRPHPYLHYQLGKDLQAQERWTESAASYVLALADVPGDAPWRHSLVVRALSVLGKAGDFQRALTLAELTGDEWADSPDYHFALGNVFLDLGLADPASAATAIPLVEASWRRALVIGDRPDLPGSMPGRGSWLAAHNLAAFYESTGDLATARLYRERYPRPAG